MSGPLLRDKSNRPSTTPHMRRSGPLDEAQRSIVAVQERRVRSVMKDITPCAREKMRSSPEVQNTSSVI